MKGYLILDFSIKDFGRFKEYIEKIPAFIKKHGFKSDKLQLAFCSCLTYFSQLKFAA